MTLVAIHGTVPNGVTGLQNLPIRARTSRRHPFGANRADPIIHRSSHCGTALAGEGMGFRVEQDRETHCRGGWEAGREQDAFLAEGCSPQDSPGLHHLPHHPKK